MAALGAFENAGTRVHVLVYIFKLIGVAILVAAGVYMHMVGLTPGRLESQGWAMFLIVLVQNAGWSFDLAVLEYRVARSAGTKAAISALPAETRRWNALQRYRAFNKRLLIGQIESGSASRSLRVLIWLLGLLSLACGVGWCIDEKFRASGGWIALLVGFSAYFTCLRSYTLLMSGN